MLFVHLDKCVHRPGLRERLVHPALLQELLALLDGRGVFLQGLPGVAGGEARQRLFLRLSATRRSDGRTFGGRLRVLFFRPWLADRPFDRRPNSLDRPLLPLVLWGAYLENGVQELHGLLELLVGRVGDRGVEGADAA